MMTWPGCRNWQRTFLLGSPHRSKTRSARPLDPGQYSLLSCSRKIPVTQQDTTSSYWRCHVIRKFHRAAVIAVAMMVCATLSANDATAAEIKLVASSNAAMRSALSELAPEFERSTGHKVSMEFGPAPFLKG